MDTFDTNYMYASEANNAQVRAVAAVLYMYT